MRRPVSLSLGASGAALALWASTAAGARAAAPASVPFRTVPPNEVPRVLMGVARDWAKDLDEVQAFRRYVRDRDNWSPGFLAAAGAFGFFKGGKGSARLGRWDLRLDTAGQSLQSILLDPDDRRFGLGLGAREQGWSADAVLGLRDGRLLGDSITLAYRLRY